MSRTVDEVIEAVWARMPASLEQGKPGWSAARAVVEAMAVEIVAFEVEVEKLVEQASYERVQRDFQHMRRGGS